MPHPKDKQIEKIEIRSTCECPQCEADLVLATKINELIDCYNSLVQKKE